MKILYLAHRIPYPPNKGDKIRSFNEIKYLSTFHEIDLVCLADNPDDLRFQEDLEKYCNRIFVLPFKTTLAKLKGLANLATGKSISVGYFYSKKIQQKVDKWMTETDYDAIICFSSSMAEYIFCSPLLISRFSNHLTLSDPQPSTRNLQLATRNPSTKLIMDFCDVDSEKWLQYSQRSKFPLNLIYRIENKNLLEYEKKINKAFDYSIFVSGQEADLFFRLFPKAKNVAAIPNGVDHKYFSPKNPNNASNLINQLMFAGAMDYFANIDGVKWFCEKIFPKIKADYPKVQFYIVGSNPQTAVHDLEKNKDVIVTGFVEDIRPYYMAADVCVIPLRLARGVQNKVLEAMSMGKAVVTTSAAIQGITAVPGEHLLVADNPDDFADTVSMLLKDKDLRTQLGTSARGFVKSHYNWQTNMKRFEELIVA
jgi:sugar transferase (PEP-CTERM/EpsH1 system associated)